jgi:sulfate adenylyltransferase (ADP) / ATP adenylyltransferase
MVAAYNAMVSSCFGEAPLQRGSFADDQSYNLILTNLYMMLVPRSRESWGPVGLNAMGFAGSFFVRSQEELSHIEQKSGLQVLSEVGVPW